MTRVIKPIIIIKNFETFFISPMNQPKTSFYPAPNTDGSIFNDTNDKFLQKKLILLGIIKRKILETRCFSTNASMSSSIQPNQCIVCKEETANTEQFLADCQHRGNYCKSCLHYYAIYNIENKNRVLCPFEGCPFELKTSSPFFDSLPAPAQAKYLRTHSFNQALADSTLRACFRNGFQGTVCLSNNYPISCNLCRTQFCQDCLLQRHNGDCSIIGLRFFEEKLKYRKCPRCKILVDRLPSTNRIQCSCSYQFCYICGVEWQQMHFNKHDENGIPTNKAGKVSQYQQMREVDLPEDGDKSCSKLCCQIIFYVTLIPRLIIALILFCLLIAFLPLMLLFVGFSMYCLGFQFSPNLNYMGPDEIERYLCISAIIENYLRLFSKVKRTFLYSLD